MSTELGRAFPAAWREVRPVILILLALLAAALLWVPWLALLPGLLLLGTVFFFRDPDRIPESEDPGAILSPADGRVTVIEKVEEPHILQGPAVRISIFLSLMDVHNQRSPCDGTVCCVQYRQGEFAPAYLQDTSRNESNLVGLETGRGRVAIKQIAGILARRIVCWPAAGERLNRGQRFGLIKFGSRVDLYLPPGVEITTAVGRQVYGGQTVVACWPS